MTKQQNIYTVGGTVQAGNGVYIPRRADDQLLTLCRSRTFAYVLTPRQMGKSSLMVQTAEQLKKEGVCTAIIDLQPIGAQVSPEEWYLGLLTEIEDQLDLDTDLLGWWEARTHLGLVQRMTRFFSEVVLSEIDCPIVVFIDEIDTTLDLDFTDDFFIALRYFYTARAQKPEFERLSFVLIGVAAPSELIQSKDRAPFNIGYSVNLLGFQIAEIEPLRKGLSAFAEDSTGVLRAILDWTGGQPLLTQKICTLVTDSEPILRGEEVAYIATLVKDRILKNWELQDTPEHLRTIENRLLRNTQNSKKRLALLAMYKQILEGENIHATGDSIQVELQLSGLVTEHNGLLRLCNQIYEKVFDIHWVNKNLKDLRPYSEKIESWLETRKSEHLLKGKELKDALKWSENTILSKYDLEFLIESSQNEMKSIEQQHVKEMGKIKAQIMDGRPLVSKLERSLADLTIKYSDMQSRLNEEKRKTSNLQQNDSKKQIQRNLNRLISESEIGSLLKEEEELIRERTRLLSTQHKRYSKHQESERSSLQRRERIRKKSIFVKMVLFVIPFLAFTTSVLLHPASRNTSANEFVFLPCGTRSLLAAFIVVSQTNEDFIKVYERPDLDSEVRGFLKNGEVVNLFLCAKEGFIMSFQGDWIPLEDVVNVTKERVEEYDLLAEVKHVRTEKSLVSVKSSPSDNVPILGFVDNGTFLIVDDNSRIGDWVKIEGGGWIKSDS